MKAEIPNWQIPTAAEMFQAPLHMMATEMFKKYVIDCLANHDSRAIDLLIPLMLMATEQYDIARSILCNKTSVTGEQLYSLHNNPVTAELARMVDFATREGNFAESCEKLLPYVKRIEFKDAITGSITETKVKEIARNINHIVIVPDGDRRWAKERALHPSEGHKQLAKNVPTLFQECWKLGIHTTTLSLTSTETWKRDTEELNTLFLIFNDLLIELFSLAKKFNVKMVHLGRKDRIPSYLLKTIQYVELETKNYQDHIFNFAIDYGGKDEIVRSIKKILENIQRNNIELKDLKITEDLIASNLDVGNQPYPAPDFVIRTGKEQRISGFMSWEASYSELYFPSIYFPDFNKNALYEAIVNFGKRERRFGK